MALMQVPEQVFVIEKISEQLTHTMTHRKKSDTAAYASMENMQNSRTKWG